MDAGLQTVCYLLMSTLGRKMGQLCINLSAAILLSFVVTFTHFCTSGRATLPKLSPKSFLARPCHPRRLPLSYWAPAADGIVPSMTAVSGLC